MWLDPIRFAWLRRRIRAAINASTTFQLSLQMSSLFNRQHVIAARLLKDAQLTELSDATRIAVAFEAGFIYLQYTTAQKSHGSPVVIPNKVALSAAFERLQCSPSDRLLGMQLMEWFENRYQLPPGPCPADAAVAWAMRMSTISGL